jgi:hypothetical protein
MRPYKSRSEPAPRGDDKKDGGRVCLPDDPANSKRSTEEGKMKHKKKQGKSACPMPPAGLRQHRLYAAVLLTLARP